MLKRIVSSHTRGRTPPLPKKTMKQLEFEVKWKEELEKIEGWVVSSSQEREDRESGRARERIDDLPFAPFATVRLYFRSAVD